MARGGGAAARPPQASGAELDLFSVHGRGDRGGLRVLAPQPRPGATRDREVLVGRARVQARLRPGLHPAHLRARSCSTSLGPPRELRGHDVLAFMEIDDSDDAVPYCQADELSGAHPDLQGPRASSYRELPLRLAELGSTSTATSARGSSTGHAARARLHHGRLAHIFCTPDQLPAEIARRDRSRAPHRDHLRLRVHMPTCSPRVPRPTEDHRRRRGAGRSHQGVLE